MKVFSRGILNKMRALIDADVLVYEVGFGSQWLNEDGDLVYKDYDSMRELFSEKIRIINEEVGATKPPLLFLSNNEVVNRLLVKRGKNITYEKNFRDKIAKTKVYKGTRKVEKPFHMLNIVALILDNYEYIIANGCEADDMLANYQTTSKEKTIICSRDKDLRICPGLHYSWECGRQPSVGPLEFDKIGYIKRVGAKSNKIFGGGLAFFYSQLITGDVVDNIPGLPGGGPALAERTLSGCETEEDLFTSVAELYKEKIGDNWEEYMREQADLLWIVQEFSNGKPVFYKWPNTNIR